ncbi:MAG: AAA family ATPase [Pyrobaculum sp.]|jgi:energy-coupling factor transporter ATP-binding protein EcfA2
MDSQGGAELVLTLENVGPLKEASIELGKGLTVLYGLNGTGKTTVAKALRLLARLNLGAATAEDVIRLVKRQLKHMNRFETEGRAGRIVYRTADSELEVKCVPDVRGAKLRIGQWERYAVANELLPAVDKPRVVLLWVAHNSVEIHGVGVQKEHMSMEDLLIPTEFRGIATYVYDDVMDLYEEVIEEANKILETIDYAVNYRDGVYFRNGIHVYTTDEVSSGVKRLTLILLAKAVAKKFAEYTELRPVLFIENFEDSLDVTLMRAVIDMLRSTKGIVSVAETHSGFPLRAAVMIRKNTNYYVFANGRATRELKIELFKREIAEWADVNAL